MAYDGIVTRAVVRELQKNILLGKIEKVYQPEADELVFHIHTKNGNRKLVTSWLCTLLSSHPMLAKLISLSSSGRVLLQ